MSCFFPNFKENTAIFPNSKGPGPQSQKGVWEPCHMLEFEFCVLMYVLKQLTYYRYDNWPSLHCYIHVGRRYNELVYNIANLK